MIKLLEVLTILPFSIALGLELGNLFNYETADTRILIFIGSVALLFYLKFREEVKDLYFIVCLLVFCVILRLI